MWWAVVVTRLLGGGVLSWGVGRCRAVLLLCLRGGELFFLLFIL